MNPKVGTIMGKLNVVAGVKQEQAMNVAAVKPARGILRKPKKERLYTILDVTGEPLGRDEIYSEMIRIIGEEYFQARGSVTAKLRQAIGAANSFLLQENLSALPLEQRAGGVTCAVFKEGNVYIAQAGPTVAYVSYQGKLKSFPEIPIAELTAEEAAPLGFKRGIPLRLYRTKVGLGDVILLTSGSLAQQVSREQIAQALTGKDVDVALASLEQLAGEGDASAMLVRVAPVEEKPAVRPQAVMRPARARVEAAATERLPRPDWSSLERRLSSLLANASKATGDFLRRLLPEPAPSSLTERAEVPAKAKEAPVPSKPVPRRPPRPADRGRNLWMSIAIAIPVIVVILVITVYWRQGLGRQARFAELMTQARRQVEMAGQVDGATARSYLLEALDYLVEAEELVPGQPEVSELRTQTGYILKKIDRVTELDWIQLLWEYGEPGSNPSRVIVANDIDVYVLDKGLHRIYKHLLDEAKHALQKLEVDPVLLRKGDQRDPIVVGDLIDMAWVQAEGWRSKDSLLVLESGGSLLEYDPLKGISVLPIGGRERWIRPQITGSYEGNFYLLDSSLNQILRYEPDYGGSPEDYFPAPGEVNLAGVVDMALDGQIYLLYADGRVLKFDDGQPAPFEITGLYEPMQNPTALFTSRESQFLYITDAGNKRILQLTKEGGFLRQLKAGQGEAFDDLKGLFAIEKYNLLYLVSGNKLYVTNIPAD
jgi:hypothetical protein